MRVNVMFQAVQTETDISRYIRHTSYSAAENNQVKYLSVLSYTCQLLIRIGCNLVGICVVVGASLPPQKKNH